MPEIICSVCGKKAIIPKFEGKLCLDCWRKGRKDRRDEKNVIYLDSCFNKYNTEKLSPAEEKILNEVMCELERESKK